MAEQAARLGDLIDDHCPRCKLLLNHAVASLMDGQVVKVICKTCYTEHAYRHGEGGKKKAPSGVTLFEQVLAHSGPSALPDSSDAPSAAKKKKRGRASARYISRRKTGPRKK